MKVSWRRSAIESLMELDQWRETIKLPKIASYLKETIQTYFQNQDLSFYIPGRPVCLQEEQIDLSMVLIALGKSDPYKVFYRAEDLTFVIYLVRHSKQRPVQ